LVIAGTLNVTLIPFATLLLAKGYGRADFWVGVEAVSLVILIGALISSLGAEYARQHGLLIASRDATGNRAAITIWYGVIVLSIAAAVLAPFAPWVALAIVVITRISALLPLGSDRLGLPGDLRSGFTT